MPLPGWFPLVNPLVNLLRHLPAGLQRRLMFRPVFETTRVRCREEVAAGPEFAVCLRAWVYGGNSEECMAYVTRVEINGEVVDMERSQLQWTDEAGEGDTFKAVWNDLYQSHLVRGGGEYIATPVWNLVKRGPTALGERFLAFVEDPRG